jgi:hypothetical protein
MSHTFLNNYYNIEDIHISEKEKNSFDYLKSSMDFYISSLVIEKEHLTTARNLYDGIRGSSEFKYLEKVFGMETPLALTMTPLIKTRIDVLLGLLLDESFTYRATYNDSKTIAKIEEERKAYRAKKIKKRFTELLEKAKKDPNSIFTEHEKAFTENLLKNLDENFVASFEIIIQKLLKFFEQDQTIGFKQKIKQFFLDLLVTGEAYYRSYVDRVGSDPVLEICKPENIFYSKNTNFQFLSTGRKPHVTAIVHRTFMRRSEILQKWGHLLDETAKTQLFGNFSYNTGMSIPNGRVLESLYRFNNVYDTGLVHNQHTGSLLDTLPVYHVEWLANNEIDITEAERKDFQTVEDSYTDERSQVIYGENMGSSTPKEIAYRLDRYEGIRIGWDIYLNCGKSKHIQRSNTNIYETTLSYNGVAYNDRNGKPYSLALALKDIQDVYDIIKFYRNNLIANSGVDGSRVNLAAIPKVLGQNFMERLLKFIQLRKQGLELIDPTEEGANLFSHYGDYKASLNPQIIQSLELVLEGLEKEADIVTGINRYMYQAAEVRDAVQNVRVGQQTTSLITKDMYSLVHTSVEHCLTDLISAAQICYKKGKKGSYIIGDKTLTFEIEKDSFHFTDYNIHVTNTDKEKMKIQKLDALLPELIKAGLVEPELLTDIVISESTTEILGKVQKSMAKKKEENDQLKQLTEGYEQAQEQLKQYEEELKKMQQEMEKLSKQADSFKERDIALRERTEERRLTLEERRINIQERETAAEVAKDKAVVELEREQLHAENVAGNAREIKDDL